MRVPIKRCYHGFNTRSKSRYTEKSIASFAPQLDRHGQINDIVVTETSKGYAVIAGMRRVLAARLLGWEEISAKVITAKEAELLSISLSENLHREAMPPMDIADAVEKLAELQGLNQTECAKHFDVSVSFISECVNAKARLSKAVIEILKGQGISAHTLISKLPEDKQLGVAQAFVSKGWTRAQLKKHVAKLTKKSKRSDPRVTVTLKALPTYDALFSRLTQAINTLKTLKNFPSDKVDFAAILSEETNE
ncbi:MAG: ParB/RepB/Spo0J family partition protein [Planctomycetales bacterium]|nr:ParB/RepB/Spo0J family partition protein [Planctomycetales bacterium]